MLCVATDYPHLTFDDPNYIAGLLPHEWHSKIFFENAADLCHWKDDAKAAFGAVKVPFVAAPGCSVQLDLWVDAP